MSNKCLKCGAQLPAGEQCQERFGLCLAWEHEHPASFGAVHHLTVACYMLQHNEYSRQAWLAAREMIVQAIYQGISPKELAKRNRRAFGSGQRSWGITEGEKLAGVEDIVWTRTIADVRLDSPEAYCQDVRLWAASVIVDSEAFVQKLVDDS